MYNTAWSHFLKENISELYTICYICWCTAFSFEKNIVLNTLCFEIRSFANDTLMAQLIFFWFSRHHQRRRKTSSKNLNIQNMSVISWQAIQSGCVSLFFRLTFVLRGNQVITLRYIYYANVKMKFFSYICCQRLERVNIFSGVVRLLELLGEKSYKLFPMVRRTSFAFSWGNLVKCARNWSYCSATLFRYGYFEKR